MAHWRRLGLIAGGGPLPLRLAAHSEALGRPCFVARLPGLAAPGLEAFAGAEFGFGEIAARFAAMRAFGVDAVVFAGHVRRPDFAALKVDAQGLRLLPKVLAAAALGDDALNRALVETCEAEGFRVLAVEEVLGGLLARAGPLGSAAPDAAARADIAKAAALVAALGPFDVGQGAVVRDGLVLAVEAQEGTDAMLRRVAEIAPASPPRGVLVKRPKPQQERRVDLPVIGPATLVGLAAAGLAGVAIEAGAALIVDGEAVRAQADAHGLFVFGFEAADGP